MYTMTGLYSETTGDDSSIDVPADSENSESSCTNISDIPASASTANSHLADTVIKCHSRQASSGIIDRDKPLPLIRQDDDLTRDCGLLGCRPAAIQKFARIKVFFILQSIFQNEFTMILFISCRYLCYCYQC